MAGDHREPKYLVYPEAGAGEREEGSRGLALNSEHSRQHSCTSQCGSMGNSRDIDSRLLLLLVTERPPRGHMCLGIPAEVNAYRCQEG